ncbi:hypothetical protein [Hymenobacter sp. YC55]|uniref:hypothetical protein n=1 Tax=Hymenobacter sp. YC55 TaxID=3034019 RepID=UPI0023F88AC3|nr:hypothetical protein [Hymenobacter sp. YC55]MDF7810743.1 hypothetical protein [Hymenobacter sp. YC55]
MALVYLNGRIVVAGPQVEETLAIFLQQVRMLPGYRLIWRGAPASVKEWQACHWMDHQPNSLGYRLQDNEYLDYRNPTRPNEGMKSARKSFASAIAVLAKLAGHVPKEVVVFTIR